MLVFLVVLLEEDSVCLLPAEINSEKDAGRNFYNMLLENTWVCNSLVMFAAYIFLNCSGVKTSFFNFVCVCGLVNQFCKKFRGWWVTFAQPYDPVI